MFAKRLWLGMAVAVVGMTGTARADFVIDDFSAPAPAQYYQIDLINGNPYNRIDSIANGLTRDLTVTVVNPSPTNPNSASGYIGTRPSTGAPSGPIFSMDSDNSSTVTAALAYTGFSGMMANFASAGAINLGFFTLDSGTTSQTMPITIMLMTGSGTLSYTGTAAESETPFTFSADLSNFTGTGDLSDVTGLKVTLNGTTSQEKAADYVLDNITVSTVPAPPAAILGLVALPVLGMYRRFRKPAVVA